MRPASNVSYLLRLLSYNSCTFNAISKSGVTLVGLYTEYPDSVDLIRPVKNLPPETPKVRLCTATLLT